MKKSSELAEYVVDQLQEFGSSTARRMFGGYGIYHQEIMFGLIADDVFFLKVDDTNQGAFEAAGSKPFTYAFAGRKKPVQMSYWEVPAEVLDDNEALADWAKGAFAAAKRAQAGKKKKTRKPRGNSRRTSVRV